MSVSHKHAIWDVTEFVQQILEEKENLKILECAVGFKIFKTLYLEFISTSVFNSKTPVFHYMHGKT